MVGHHWHFRPAMNNNESLRSLQLNAERASNDVHKALLDTPRADRTTEWEEVYYGDGHLNDKKWAKFLKAYEGSNCISPSVAPLRAASVELRNVYKAARAAEKARLAEVRAQRAARAKVVAEHGKHRPDAVANPLAAHNYDTLKSSPYLEGVRKEFVAAYVDTLERVFISAQERLQPQYRALKFDSDKAFWAANEEFNAYLAKLALKNVEKIISVDSLTGNLWNGSLLSVLLENQVVAVWETKCILNVSSLGKLFNQWPTRRIK